MHPSGASEKNELQEQTVVSICNPPLTPSFNVAQELPQDAYRKVRFFRNAGTLWLSPPTLKLGVTGGLGLRIHLFAKFVFFARTGPPC